MTGISMPTGISGGPIFYFDENGKPKVVGMVSGAIADYTGDARHPLPLFDPQSKMSRKYANVGVLNQAFLPEVQPFIDRDLERYRANLLKPEEPLPQR
jgi:hypothetical protein